MLDLRSAYLATASVFAPARAHGFRRVLAEHCSPEGSAPVPGVVQPPAGLHHDCRDWAADHPDLWGYCAPVGSPPAVPVAAREPGRSRVDRHHHRRGCRDWMADRRVPLEDYFPAGSLRSARALFDGHSPVDSSAVRWNRQLPIAPEVPDGHATATLKHSTAAAFQSRSLPMAGLGLRRALPAVFRKALEPPVVGSLPRWCDS